MSQQMAEKGADFQSVRLGPHVFHFAALGRPHENGAHEYGFTVESDIPDKTPTFPEIFDAAEKAIGVRPAMTDGHTVTVRHRNEDVVPYFSTNPFENHSESKPPHVGEALFPVLGQR